MNVLNPKFEKAHKDFVLHFGYCPQIPNEIDFDQSKYADDLLKSVADNYDYTIEKYGTQVPKKYPKPDYKITRTVDTTDQKWLVVFLCLFLRKRE